MGAALFGLLVHLVGAMGGYLHFALVEHERCPEHGELIHAGEHAEARDRADAAPVSAHTPAQASPAGQAEDDSHDPCFAVASLSPRFCLSSANAGAAGPEGGEELGRPARERVGLVVAILDLAPKTSPPALRA